MKNIFGFLLVAISSAIIAGGVYAQCPTPKDCPGDPYNGPFYRTIPLSPTCSLRYEYCWRTAHCVGGLMDTYIGDLELVGDCDAFKDDILMNLNTYLQACHDDVVLNVDPWNFQNGSDMPECCPPSSSPCWTDWFWRQGNYTCYTDWYWDTWKQAWVSTECDVENPGSCWHMTKYCWYMEEGPSGPIKKYKSESDFWEGTNICPPLGGPNDDLECHPSCDH